jgi:hypothetical protein
MFSRKWYKKDSEIGLVALRGAGKPTWLSWIRMMEVTVLGNIFGALVLTLIGAALLLNGYRWFRVLLPIWAFLVGYGVIAGLLSALFGDGFFSTALTIIPGIILGVIFAVLSYLWYALAVLFWAGTVGYVLFAGLLAALGFSNGFIIWSAGLIRSVCLHRYRHAFRP